MVNEIDLRALSNEELVNLIRERWEYLEKQAKKLEEIERIAEDFFRAKATPIAVYEAMELYELLSKIRKIIKGEVDKSG